MTARPDVAALRMLTETTGQITQVQVKSVTSWPKVAFKDLDSHETRIDPEKHTVEYVLKLKSKKKISDLRALKIIEESVWALLGDTWQTSFRVGKSILYIGSRRQEIRDAGAVNFGKGRAGFDSEGAGSL